MKYTEWHHEVHEAQPSVLHDATLLELFVNEFNLVEKAPHARDFRRSILELYHNRSIRECTK